MKTGRLVIGIITIVLSVLVMFQSCAAGLANTLAETGEVSGSAGFILSLCFLIAGIVGIVTRKRKTGAIVAGSFYLLGGFIGMANVGTFADLMIWSVLSLAFAAFFIIGGIMQKTKVL